MRRLRLRGEAERAQLAESLDALGTFLRRKPVKGARIITEEAIWSAGLVQGVTGLLEELRLPWEVCFASELWADAAPCGMDAVICIGGHGVMELPDAAYGQARRCHLPVVTADEVSCLHLIAHGIEASLNPRRSGRARANAAQATAEVIRAMRAAPEEGLDERGYQVVEQAVIAITKASRGTCGSAHILATALGGTHDPSGLSYEALHGQTHCAVTCQTLLTSLRALGEAAQSPLADIAQAAGLCSPGARDDVSADALLTWLQGQNQALQLPEAYTHIPRRDVYALAVQCERASRAHPDSPKPLNRFQAERLLLTLMEKEAPIRDAKALVERQRAYFMTNATLSIPFRKDALRKLQAAVQAREEAIHAALKEDLGKCPEEAYLCETGMVLSEVRHMIRHVEGYARRRYVPSPLAQFPSRSFVTPRPYGVALIMSPWNYPFLLTMGPLIGAIGAGCCAVVKPSAYAPATSALIRELVAECFPQDHVAVVEGGRAENQALLDQHFDKIFFTGGGVVGREVLRHAADHLTPVTLELGGKSPVVVDESANIPLAARRIAFGKLLNAGQTCVAPDYVLVHRSVRNRLVDCLKAEFTRMAGEDPLQNPNYPHIISQKHYNRVMGLIDHMRVVHGGRGDLATLRIQPTVMENITPQDAVMQEEIFGPVLPILEVDSLEEAMGFIRERATPLACYLFTESKDVKRRFLREVPFGGGCVNDTVIHLASEHLPFGGMGASGMGAYHGKDSFLCFSHTAGVLEKATWLDLPMRYAPYRAKMMRLVRIFMR